jgi:hypothetical protein
MVAIVVEVALYNRASNSYSSRVNRGTTKTVAQRRQDAIKSRQSRTRSFSSVSKYGTSTSSTRGSYGKTASTSTSGRTGRGGLG